MEKTIKPSTFAKINSIQSLSQLLEKIIIGDYEIKIINNEQVKMQTKSSIVYINIVKEL